MRIGLLSDTHIPQAANELPMEQLKVAFKGVDLIMHGGDIYSKSVLEDLSQIAPVIAALGDDDYGETARDERVRTRHIVDIEGHRIWLVHERPYYLSPLVSPYQREKETVNTEVPEIVVFGHQHKTILENHQGRLFVSPGSPTFLNYMQGLGTVGILDINDGKVDVNIMHL